MRTWLRAAVGTAALISLVACGDDGMDPDSDGGTPDAAFDGGAGDAGPDDDAGADEDGGDEDAGGDLDATIELDATLDDDGGVIVDVDAFVPDVDAGAGEDAGATDAGTPVDGGPIDATAPSARIDLVRMTSGTLATPIHIDTVQITYVLPAVGDDPGGVFVQSDLTGPALFVAVDPSTLTPAPIEGVYASFSVAATAVVGGQHRVTALVPGSWAAGSTPVGGIVAEPQGLRAIAVPSMLDALESELSVNELDMASDFVACGLDRFCAQVTSPGVPAATPSYRFRTTQSIASGLGLARRCHLVMGEYPSALEHATPLWRRGSEANPQVTRREEITGAACGLPRLIGAYATGPTAVTVVFDAPIDPATVAASDFTWIGGVTTVAAGVSTVSPYLVTLTTSALTLGSTNTVMASGVRDVLGIDAVAGTAATFTARTAGTAPNAAGQVVITEVMHDPAGAEPAGEWIELWNPGTTPMALAGCTLQDSTSSTYTITTLSIPGGGRVTLSSGADPGFAESQSYGAALTLDATDSLILRCGGTIIDEVEWTGAFQAVAGRSLSLDPQHHAAALNDEAVAWCTAATAYGAERGTPGAANDDCR